MAKPIIKKITPFDANLDYEIDIFWTGSRAHANRVIIYDNESNNVIFDDTITSFSLKHKIPAYTLANGKSWVIQAQTFDEENIASALSDKVLFHTLETPDFYFSNLPENNKITNASLAASVYYYSSDWENISSYIFYLYDSTKKLLTQSAALSDDVSINYVYRGLENNTDYYIRCVGNTVNGMSLDTGYILIGVKYENPNTYARIYADSIPTQGCVQVSSNLIILQYNGSDSFDYEDGMIDLIGKTLYYDEGFLIEDDFTVLLRGMNLWQNADLLKMKNGQSGLTLSSHIYGGEKLRFKLAVPNGINTYIIYSDEQVFESGDMITVAIRRKNNVYQLKVFIELNYSTEGNIWYGRSRPASGSGKYDIWIDTHEDTYVTDRASVSEFLDETEPLNVILDDIWLGGE